MSDVPGEAMVKLYCPRCMDVYTPKSSRHHHTDGAYFGTGFPHMVFMVHPEYRPKRPASQFVPRWVTLWKLRRRSHCSSEQWLRRQKRTTSLWMNDQMVQLQSATLQSQQSLFCFIYTNTKYVKCNFGNYWTYPKDYLINHLQEIGLPTFLPLLYIKILPAVNIYVI